MTCCAGRATAATACTSSRRGLLQVLDGESGEVLGRQRVGDVVGEVALLTRDPRSATLVAQVPSVVSELSRDDFLAAATHHPRLLVNLATIVSRRLVSRTAPSSGRVTALVVRPGGWEGEGAATAAARASSAAPLTVLDGTGPLPELLAAIDAAVGTPVLVRVPSDARAPDPGPRPVRPHAGCRGSPGAGGCRPGPSGWTPASTPPGWVDGWRTRRSGSPSARAGPRAGPTSGCCAAWSGPGTSWTPSRAAASGRGSGRGPRWVTTPRRSRGCSASGSTTTPCTRSSARAARRAPP